MFIVPINSTISPIKSVFDNTENSIDTSESSKPVGFADIFKDIYANVEETQAQVNLDAINVINGGIDDLHTIQNNLTKAEIAVETFVAVKNASVDAYNQILQITM